MADFTVTAANVLPSTSARLVQGIAGAAITMGQSVYLDTVTNTYKKADANGISPLYVFAGIAVSTAAAAGQPIIICTGDPSFQTGFTIAGAGEIIIVSGTTAGGLCYWADVESGWYVTLVGVAISTTKINFSTVAAGAVFP